MGLLDDPAFAEELLKKAVAAYEAKDSGSPLTTGLLSAGLGILANNKGNGWNAIGQGGLLGLQGYQQAKQQQAKDPMQLLQVAAAAQGLQQNALNSREMQAFQNARNPQPMAPQSDYAPGEAPGPQTPPMVAPAAQQTQGGPPPLQMLMQYVGSRNPQVAQRALEEIKTFYPQFELGTGAQRYGNDGRLIAQNLDPTKPIPMPGGGFGLAPNQVSSLAQIESAKVPAAIATAQGTEAAKAAQDVISVTEGGSPRNVVRSQYIAEQQGGVDPQMAAAYADYLKNGGPAQGAFRYTPPSKRNPTKAEEAAQVQAATQAGELNKGLAEGLGKYSIENLAAGHKVAEEAAFGTLPAIQEVRDKIKAGAFTGGGAETKTAVLNQINGWFGTSIASPQVAQSMALKSALGNELLANAKKLGYNPTDTDARRIDDIIGRQGLSKEALLEIANMQERMARQAIDRHNKRLDSMEGALKERGLPTDTIATLKVKPAENKPEAKAVNPQLQSVVEEMRRRGLIQ